VDDAGEVAGLFHQVVMFGGRAGDAGGVGFLEGVVADQMGGDLAGEADDGDAVHQGVDQAGDGVGRTRAAGDEHDADAAGAAGVAFGGVDGGLFVADEDVADGVLLEDGVVDRQDGAAGVAEDDLDALVLEGAQEDFGADLREVGGEGLRIGGGYIGHDAPN
jgi:hypothetical protein